MYWYAKVIIGLIVILFLGGVVFLFRGCLPAMSGISLPGGMLPDDDVVETETEESPRAEQADPEVQAIREQLRIVRTHLNGGSIVEARDAAERILGQIDTEKHKMQWRNTLKLLSEASTQILFSNIPAPEKVDYTVVRGDALAKIAAKFNTPVPLVQLGNGMDETEDVIYEGNVLHVYTADWNIWVSKTDFLLLVKDGDRVIKAYDIGIGAQNRTPVGTFHINVKQSDPAWDKPGYGKIPAGHPDNVLGTRWMGLKPIDETPKTLKGYGIHGTTEPDTIGTAASQGCVRMLNTDVEELCRIVPYRTLVVIED